MPYNNTSDLPQRVKGNLPKHAQEIYMKAFNSAHQQYQDPKKRRGNSNLEQTAHRVAWSAVEKEYKKDNSGNWVRK